MTTMAGFMSVMLTIIGAVLILPILLALFIVIYLFVASPIKIEGNSMHPNVQSGQYWITNKLTLRERNPERYDVIIYKKPGDTSKELVGRVIALPGETIEIKDNALYINQTIEDTTYLAAGTFTSPGDLIPSDQTQLVPKDEFVILGDNRAHSFDSRSYGTIHKQMIVSKLWFCYWNCF